MEKTFAKERKLIENKLRDIPVVAECRSLPAKAGGFDIHVTLNSGETETASIYVLSSGYPKEIIKTAESIYQDASCHIILAPYISEAAACLCEARGLGYMDMSGNCRIIIGPLYISEKGNPNKAPEKRRAANIFKPSSTVSSSMLRKMLAQPGRYWRIKELAQETGCSIGMVSKVKDILCEQLWAEMSGDGLYITDRAGLLGAWAGAYTMPSDGMVSCYTLDPLSDFEKKLQKISDESRINSYLTGFSGGVRYAPVVRYNRIHVFVEQGYAEELADISGCKITDSGANVIIMETEADKLIDARIINGCMTVSPVQAYLDCMQLKGRGEELAKAIYDKEIGNDT